MADSNWKKRLGINLNYSSGEEEDQDSKVEYRRKPGPENATKPIFLGIDESLNRESSTDDIISQYDQYGSTPPRTRIKNKNRDWDRKQKIEATSAKPRGASRMVRSRVNRRNTMDCALLNQMFMEDDETKKANDKRSMQLLRESERDMKASANNTVNAAAVKRYSAGPHERADSMPVTVLLSANPLTLSTVVESCNRFMSVSSRPVGCRMSAPPSAFALPHGSFKVFEKKENEPVLHNRQEFHETFSNLIKLGSSEKQDKNCKRALSREEILWQTELKDLIWLELQAYHADRTLEQQDKYLLSARQLVGELLREIMEYRFRPSYYRTASNTSDVDSGIDSLYSTQESNTSRNNNNSNNSNCSNNLNSSGSSNTNGNNSTDMCLGCLSMYCRYCLNEQSRALKQVEILLTRLEAAESLYPSTQAFGSYYPLYNSAGFIGRVKAMCLWYNITRHHRLKLLILGKLLARLQGKHFQWPVVNPINPNDSSSSSSSAHENEDSGRDTNDSSENNTEQKQQRHVKVQFHIEHADSDNPSDSASSTESANNNLNDDGQDDTSQPPSGSEYSQLLNHVNLYNVQPLADATFVNVKQSTSPYRKYIENVLKSRGLGKSLSFLHRLHNVVLRKAHVTLVKPGNEDFETEMGVFDEDTPYIEVPIGKEEVEELRRYGAWSPESKALGLPSYVPAFIFLSLIPLEVVHEFLRMKLETKPINPNPLSLEQLMKELRQGLTLAIIHRERFNRHISTALYDKELEMEQYITILEEFDNTVKQVLELYLDYVEQWVLVSAPENHQKSALDEEWMFTKLVCPMISGQHSIAAKKFCMIISSLLQNIRNRLVTRSEELDYKTINLDTSDGCGDALKWELLSICRETQALFTDEREKSVKIMGFAKSLCRDIEQVDFHRDHCDSEVCKDPDEFVCGDVKEAVNLLKKETLVVREKLTQIIARVQERCDVKYMGDMDEADRISVISRSREILHQGYKFGFEYHRDVGRLFETKIASCKDQVCELNLSMGIVTFAKMWMKFVVERCERGRGVRPRWANQGLEFLINACDPHNTKHLADKQFDELTTMMDSCISHVIGSKTEPERIRPSPRARRASPAPPNRSRTPTRAALSSTPLTYNQKPYSQQLSLREDSLGLSPTSTPDSPDFLRKQTSCDNSVVTLVVPKINTYSPALRQIRIRDSINRLDMEIENRLREKNLIGQVKSLLNCDKFHLRARSVTFRWHRGIKIGQGRFGKVYTAVNNSTGELMAMKEIPNQPGENRAIRRVAEELKIFEGIHHRHLVKYYGVEIHREELLIFMELCSEGTLESLVELSGGLYEGLTRRFTAQLLSAAAELHKHGVVHQDIKTANIFLTNGGNCLKLGDFGSAVKIQQHSTMPGELQGYVGTQAYMAPEVFTKTNTEGHGRMADIWSIGCCVVEMASGTRPWAQFDSNFQIMFKVGMGEKPEIPDTLSQEGHEFLDHCFQHDPKDRWSAQQLLHHNFCKVVEVDCGCNEEKELRRSFRKGTAKSPTKA